MRDPEVAKRAQAILAGLDRTIRSELSGCRDNVVVAIAQRNQLRAMLREAQAGVSPSAAPASPLAAVETAVGADAARSQQQDPADRIGLLTRQLQEAEVMVEAIEKSLADWMMRVREDAARQLREVTDWNEEQIQERISLALGTASHE
jgi:hypothetical protein